jgi:hypothetical protein
MQAGGGAPRVCGCCGTRAEPLRACAGCSRALFCSRACQRSAWPAHKAECGGKTPKPQGGDADAGAPRAPRDAAELGNALRRLPADAQASMLASLLPSLWEEHPGCRDALLQALAATQAAIKASASRTARVAASEAALKLLAPPLRETAQPAWSDAACAALHAACASLAEDAHALCCEAGLEARLCEDAVCAAVALLTQLTSLPATESDYAAARAARARLLNRRTVTVGPAASFGCVLTALCWVYREVLGQQLARRTLSEDHARVAVERCLDASTPPRAGDDTYPFPPAAVACTDALRCAEASAVASRLPDDTVRNLRRLAVAVRRLRFRDAPSLAAFALLASDDAATYQECSVAREHYAAQAASGQLDDVTFRANVLHMLLVRPATRVEAMEEAMQLATEGGPLHITHSRALRRTVATLTGEYDPPDAPMQPPQVFAWAAAVANAVLPRLVGACCAALADRCACALPLPPLPARNDIGDFVDQAAGKRWERGVLGPTRKTDALSTTDERAHGVVAWARLLKTHRPPWRFHVISWCGFLAKLAGEPAVAQFRDRARAQLRGHGLHIEQTGRIFEYKFCACPRHGYRGPSARADASALFITLPQHTPGITQRWMCTWARLLSCCASWRPATPPPRHRAAGRMSAWTNGRARWRMSASSRPCATCRRSRRWA